MEAYLKDRERLILEDRALRPDHSSSCSLTPQEANADEFIRRIRTAEAESVWSLDRKSVHPHGSQQMFPGMEFLTSKSTIVSTKLFKILSKMPKGALLHVHLGVTASAEELLGLSMDQPAIHVRVSQTLTADNIGSLLPEFGALPKAQWTELANITGAGYTPGSWVPIRNARDNFSEALGGTKGFYDWVTRALVIDPSEAYGTHNTSSKIWKKFQSTCDVSVPLIFFVPVWTEYIRTFFTTSIEDGISYSEPRMMFVSEYMVGADGERNIPHRVWLQIFDRVLNEVKASMHAQGRDDEFVGSKVIYTTMRHMEADKLDWYLEDCLALAQEFPHLIAGFDLVGHEDSLKPLIYYYEPLMRFVERQKELGLSIPFLFHAGETVGDGTAADMNLYDAILMGTKRMGHGFSVYKHPKLMEICRERQICLEMCPISNEILRFTGSMPMHPLPAILNHGVHVALSSDDPAVFGNMGLSFDFFQVLVASEVNGLATLRAFVWDSIQYSCMNEEEKEEALSKLERRWAKFIQSVVDEYGGDQYDI